MRWIILVLVVASVGLAYRDWVKIKPSNFESSPAPQTTTEPADTFTLEQVAQHADKTSCWLAIEGKVYDVTPFISSGFHPGKEAILQGCGKDATSMFNSRPNDGTSHSSRARSMLPKYYIGELGK